MQHAAVPKRFERWQLEEGPDGPVLRLKMAGRAVANMVFAVAVITGGVLLLGSNLAAFGVALLLLGIVWMALASLGLVDRRRVVIGVQEIAVRRTVGPSIAWPRDRIQQVRIFCRAPSASGRQGPLPWRVRLESSDGVKLPSTFRFRSEAAARELARHLAERLELEIVEAGPV